MPGEPLRENELAEMFGVSRTKVRQALMRLVQTGVAEQRLNLGARVASPSRKQAREIFQFTRLLEPALAARIAENATAKQIRKLNAHLLLEDEARRENDEAELIRLTGEFHLLLARLLENDLLDQQMMAIEALTCLSILAYTHSGVSACLPSEHKDIVAAIEAGDIEHVRHLMADHLDHVRADLDLNEPLPRSRFQKRWVSPKRGSQAARFQKIE